jgi:hypothetical protein
MRVHIALLGYVVLVFVVVHVHNIEAQTTNSGGIAGVVTDSSGAVMPGAVLELRDDAKATKHRGVTDGEGRYVFPFLRPGKYTLTVLKSGFAPTRRSFDVYLGPTASLNIVIPVATGSTSITITGETPLIKADNGDVSSTISQRQIAEVPNPGNDLTYVVQTSPGVPVLGAVARISEVLHHPHVGTIGPALHCSSTTLLFRSSIDSRRLKSRQIGICLAKLARALRPG